MLELHWNVSQKSRAALGSVSMTVLGIGFKTCSWIRLRKQKLVNLFSHKMERRPVIVDLRPNQKHFPFTQRWCFDPVCPHHKEDLLSAQRIVIIVCDLCSKHVILLWSACFYPWYGIMTMFYSYIFVVNQTLWVLSVLFLSSLVGHGHHMRD